MKVLALGDIHGDTGLAKELAERATKENVDFVVMCGDISHSDKNFEGIVGLFKQFFAVIGFLWQMSKLCIVFIGTNALIISIVPILENENPSTNSFK